MWSPLASIARSGPSRLWQAAAAASLILCGSASAQTANDARALQNPKIQSAYAEWRKLSQNEVDCVDRSLREQRSSLWLVIQRGVSPSDAAGAKLRAACRGQARAPNPSRVTEGGPQALAAVESRTNEAATKAAADKAAADKAAAEKAKADKAAADKAAADKAAAEKAAGDKAATERAAVAKAAAEKAAADKAAAERAAIDKALAHEIAADTTAHRAAVETTPADKFAADSAKPDSERANVDAAKALGEAERPRQEAATTPPAEAAFASFAAAESRISFIYGLISGPIIFSFGGVIFLLLSRRRSVPAPA